MFRALLFLVLSLLCQTVFAQYRPEAGDLLFQDLDCGPFCDAIEKVTDGKDGKEFSHIGMLVQVGDSLLVLEAGERGVVLSSMSNFLDRNLTSAGTPKVYVGRLLNNRWCEGVNWDSLIAPYLGLPYDEAFRLGDSTYYCSELVVDLVFDVLGYNPFEQNSMTFKDPETGEFFPAWLTYFEALGISIPEGAPGYNPGMMSNSEKVVITHRFF